MASARRLMTRRGVALGAAFLGVAGFALFTSIAPTSAVSGVPTPTITGGPTGLIRTRTATFTYTDSSVVNFLCALDSAPFTACPANSAKSGTITFSQITDGPHTFNVKAQIGTQPSATVSRSFSVDATAPTVLSIRRLDPNPHAFGIIRWTVTFSEPVTTVRLANFSLKSTALGATPSLVSITQTGLRAYIVSANTGPSATAGNTPTVRLNLSNEDGIKDAGGNPLADELSGETYDIDGIAPIVTISKANGVAVGFPYSTNQTVTTIGGTCGTGPGDVATVVIAGAQTGSAPCSGGNWTFTLSPSLSAGGNYTFTATQADTVGNGGTSGPKSITIDKTPPIVTVTKLNGLTVSFPLSTNANITSIGGSCGTASGDSTRVAVSINGAAAVNATCSAGAWTLPLSLTLNGVYSVIVRQTDAAGNTGSYGPVVITKSTADNTPPVVTLTRVNGSTLVEGDAAFTLANTTTKTQVQTIGGGCGSAAGDNATVSITIVGPSPSARTPTRASQTWTGAAACPATGLGAGTWTFTLNPTINADGTWDGDYVITVTQGDNAGNTGTTGAKTLTMASQPFTISGDAVKLLTPGGISDLRLTIRNPHKFPIRIDALSVDLSGTNPNCGALTNFMVVSAYPRAGLLTVPPGDTVLDVNKVPQLQMRNLNVSQDSCKSASITLTYSGMASRA